MNHRSCAALLCLALQSGCVAVDDLVHEAPSLAPQATAPDLQLPLLDGGQMSLMDLNGRYVVLKFWASYCGACARSAPEFQRELEGAGPKVALVSVSLDELRNAAQKAAKDWGLDDGPIIFFGKGYDEDPAKKAFGVRSIPETFLIDPTGQIVAHGRQLDLSAHLRAASGS